MRKTKKKVKSIEKIMDYLLLLMEHVQNRAKQIPFLTYSL